MNGRKLQSNMKVQSKLDDETILQKAFEYFMQKEFDKALIKFKKILQNDPTNRIAKLGVILCDFANEDDEEALALFDFYLILKEEKDTNAEERIMEIIQSLDNSSVNFQELLENDNLILQDGISYKDFKTIIEKRGGFKRAFEDIMYSTKVIITQKSDFFDFLENLIEHGFTDMVYSYLEDASKLYPTDEKLQKFIEKLHSEKR